jgi:hypothetical protein
MAPCVSPVSRRAAQSPPVLGDEYRASGCVWGSCFEEFKPPSQDGSFVKSNRDGEVWELGTSTGCFGGPRLVRLPDGACCWVIASPAPPQSGMQILAGGPRALQNGMEEAVFWNCLPGPMEGIIYPLPSSC